MSTTMPLLTSFSDILNPISISILQQISAPLLPSIERFESPPISRDDWPVPIDWPRPIDSPLPSESEASYSSSQILITPKSLSSAAAISASSLFDSSDQSVPASSHQKDVAPAPLAQSPNAPSCPSPTAASVESVIDVTAQVSDTLDDADSDDSDTSSETSSCASWVERPVRLSVVDFLEFNDTNHRTTAHATRTLGLGISFGPPLPTTPSFRRVRSATTAGNPYLPSPSSSSTSLDLLNVLGTRVEAERYAVHGLRIALEAAGSDEGV